LADGLLGTLVDNVADAVALTPAEWTAGVMRCSKSVAPCASDNDCPRGYCAQFPVAACDVFAQNCSEGSGPCIRNEACITGALYVYGEDIHPTDNDPAVGDSDDPPEFPVRYEVSAECSVTIPPVSTTMWRWADTNNDSILNITDILFVLLARQGDFSFSTKPNGDLAGGLNLCIPQQLLNVTDTLLGVRALQGEMYRAVPCPEICPP